MPTVTIPQLPDTPKKGLSEGLKKRFTEHAGKGELSPEAIDARIQQLEVKVQQAATGQEETEFKRELESFKQKKATLQKQKEEQRKTQKHEHANAIQEEEDGAEPSPQMLQRTRRAGYNDAGEMSRQTSPDKVVSRQVSGENANSHVAAETAPIGENAGVKAAKGRRKKKHQEDEDDNEEQLELTMNILQQLDDVCASSYSRGCPWDPGKWLEARQLLLDTGRFRELPRLMRSVRITSKRALHEKKYEIRFPNRRVRVDLHPYLTSAEAVWWFGRRNIVVPRSLSEPPGEKIIEPPIIVVDQSALDIFSRVISSKTYTNRRIYVVSEMREFGRDKMFGDLNSGSMCSMQNLLVRSDLGRFMEAASLGLRSGLSSACDHLTARHDPYMFICPDVTMFRGLRDDGYPFLEQPQHFSTIVCAMASQRPEVQTTSNWMTGVKTDWYGSDGDQTALLERLSLVGFAGLQEYDPADSSTHAILIMPTFGCADRGLHPRDAVANSLKHWRRRFGRHFHTVFLACGQDKELATAMDIAINGQVYGALLTNDVSNFRPWHWDDHLVSMHIAHRDLFTIARMWSLNLEATEKLEDLDGEMSSAEGCSQFGYETERTEELNEEDLEFLRDESAFGDVTPTAGTESGFGDLTPTGETPAPQSPESPKFLTSPVHPSWKKASSCGAEIETTSHSKPQEPPRRPSKLGMMDIMCDVFEEHKNPDSRRNSLEDEVAFLYHEAHQAGGSPKRGKALAPTDVAGSRPSSRASSCANEHRRSLNPSELASNQHHRNSMTDILTSAPSSAGGKLQQRISKQRISMSMQLSPHTAGRVPSRRFSGATNRRPSGATMVGTASRQLSMNRQGSSGGMIQKEREETEEEKARRIRDETRKRLAGSAQSRKEREMKDEDGESDKDEKDPLSPADATKIRKDAVELASLFAVAADNFWSSASPKRSKKDSVVPQHRMPSGRRTSSEMRGAQIERMLDHCAAEEKGSRLSNIFKPDSPKAYVQKVQQHAKEQQILEGPEHSHLERSASPRTSALALKGASRASSRNQSRVTSPSGTKEFAALDTIANGASEASAATSPGASTKCDESGKSPCNSSRTSLPPISLDKDHVDGSVSPSNHERHERHAKPKRTNNSLMQKAEAQLNRDGAFLKNMQTLHNSHAISGLDAEGQISFS